MVKRGVVQIVTKGTRIDNNLDSKNNNYIANIYDFDYCKGISFTDVSTGYFGAFLLEGDVDHVVREIVKRGFREIIVSEGTDRELINILRVQYGVLVSIVKDVSEDDDYSYIYSDIEDIRLTTTIKHLLSYVLETKKGDLHHLQKCEIIKRGNTLLFDNNTKKNLELVETIRSRDRQYSLLWLLDKCKTAMGSRFLKENIENPLTSKTEIERRYHFVEKLSTEFILRDDLRNFLDEVYDLERLAGRISYGNLNARDMLQLKKSLKALPKIKKTLEALSYDKTIETLDEVYALLEKSIHEEAPLTLKEGSIIKSGYNAELDELRSLSSGSKDFILNIEKIEKERTGIKNLKVGFNKVFGYYIEVSKGQTQYIKEEYGYERKQTLANCERYITKELKEKENIILGAEEKIIRLEYKLFMDIRETVKRYITNLQKIAEVISEVDMLQSFSVVSDENKFVKPELTLDKVMKLVDCRHPVVEKVIKETGLESVQKKLIKNLSRGYKQRVSMAGALVGDPDVIILDEPTVGLDPKQITEIRNLIKELGKKHTVILSTHILPEVSQICERVVIINKGKIVAVDTPENLEKKTKENNGISVTVEDKNENMKKLKELIPEIESVEMVKDNEDGTKQYTIISKADTDLRKKLFDVLPKQDITIFELKKTETTLEDAFIKLIDTKKEGEK